MSLKNRYIHVNWPKDAVKWPGIFNAKDIFNTYKAGESVV